MNGIFTAVFFLSALLFLIFSPDSFLPALLEGGQKAATLSLSLLAVYCVWLGFFRVMEQSGLSSRISTLFLPVCKKLFRTEDKRAVFLASGNLTANMLGLPGAPTPLGIQATERFMNAGNAYAASMLFVLNATSLQLIPTTVIALRASYGAQSPADVFLPTLIATLFSTLLGALCVRLFVK
ncbi:MAG: spore maturation protein [Clostridia bacterium]|nr:spore maturation protein [Clostridia bacterium]